MAPLSGDSDSHSSCRSEATDTVPGATEATRAADKDLAANTANPVLAQTEVTVEGTHHSSGGEAVDPLSTAAEVTALADGNLTHSAAGPVVAQTDVTVEVPSSGLAHGFDPNRAREYMKNIKQFRILVMGRANAGKTTILQKVCNSIDQPEIFDGEGNKVDSTAVQGTLTRGHHEIGHELVFQSNPGFVFHDSCGFDTAAAKQFGEVKEFVVERAASTTIKQRIHVIWFCIPMTDSHIAVTDAEQQFFNECDTGYVPVIVVLTKVDTLKLDAIQALEDEGLGMERAQEKIVDKERELLEKRLAQLKDMLGNCKFPPRGYVALKNMHKEMADCTALMQCTVNVLNEEGLQRLLLSTQQSSIALRIEYAVKVTLRDVLHFVNKEGCHINAKELESVLLSWLQNRLWGLGGGALGIYLQGEHLGLGALGHALLHHYREDFLEVSNEMFKFELESQATILPLSTDALLSPELQSVHSIVLYAVGCLLVVEHSYFLLQHGHCDWQKGLSVAVEEYRGSGVQTTVSQAIRDAVHYHGDDTLGLCEAVQHIIKENRMSNKFLT